MSSERPNVNGVPLLGVGDFALYARKLVETGIPDVWVEGEVLDAKESSGQHLYFTLVDGASPGARLQRGPDAQLRCVVFFSDRPSVTTPIRAGVRLRVRGNATVFGAQSSLQLVVIDAVPAGLGELAEKRAKLRAKLQAEGLFDVARKRALPRLPRTVGLVTSKKGAALHDVLTVARRRFPVRIVLAHCTVQGPDAARSVVAGLEALGRVPGIEVVIVARGGGASEDLSAFDEESVVRAIRACPVPVVTGIGHEVDVSLADLAADVRAATPSNAAERVVPDRAVLARELDVLVRRLQGRFASRVQGARLALERTSGRLAARRGALRARREAIEAIERRIERAERRRIEHARRRLTTLSARLGSADPRRRLAHARGELGRLAPLVPAAVRARLAAMHAARSDAHDRLARAMEDGLADRRHALAVLAGRLDALSPLAVLSRGYAIALDAGGRAITRARDLRPSDSLTIRVEHGTIAARVERVDDEER